MNTAESFWNQALLVIKKYGPDLFYALIVLIIGLWLIKRVNRLVLKIMDKKQLDPSLRSFLKSLISIGLKTLLIVTVISMIGINMTSFIAILGAAGLAVGMALSGTLQNFAGGVMILLIKPFKVGDYITAQGHSGTVREISIFNTVLHTPDNVVIYIPNGGLATGSLVNYSAENTRRVDLSFGIGYNDDIDRARKVLENIIDSNEKIFKEPAPFIGVKELGDSSVNFVVRLWTKSSDYWEVFFFMQETVKKTFDKENISIPYPQTDLHIYQNK